jgi:hypothetical protein
MTGSRSAILVQRHAAHQVLRFALSRGCGAHERGQRDHMRLGGAFGGGASSTRALLAGSYSFAASSRKARPAAEIWVSGQTKTSRRSIDGWVRGMISSMGVGRLTGSLGRWCPEANKPERALSRVLAEGEKQPRWRRRVRAVAAEVALADGYQESTESWTHLLRDCASRDARPWCWRSGDAHSGSGAHFRISRLALSRRFA